LEHLFLLTVEQVELSRVFGDSGAAAPEQDGCQSANRRARDGVIQPRSPHFQTKDGAERQSAKGAGFPGARPKTRESVFPRMPEQTAPQPDISARERDLRCILNILSLYRFFYFDKQTGDADPAIENRIDLE